MPRTSADDEADGRRGGESPARLSGADLDQEQAGCHEQRGHAGSEQGRLRDMDPAQLAHDEIDGGRRAERQQQVNKGQVVHHPGSLTG